MRRMSLSVCVYSKAIYSKLNLFCIGRITVTFMLSAVKSHSHSVGGGFLDVLEALQQPESKDV